MRNLVYLILLALLFFSCNESDIAEQQTVGGLQKMSNLTDAQIQELLEAGAEIIVQEPDFVVVRTTNTTKLLAFSSSQIEETDLVQRLVHVYVPDSTALQTVINSGVDFWQVKGDTAVARAFDIYIKDLRTAGLSVRIVAQDAAKWVEEMK